MGLELRPLGTAHIVTLGNRFMDALLFHCQGSQGVLESYPGSGVGCLYTLTSGQSLDFLLRFLGGGDSLSSPSLSPHCCGNSWKTALGTCLILGDFMNVRE